MAISISKQYTSTGAKDPIDLNASHSVTFGVKSNTGDAVFTIEHYLGKVGAGGWYDSGQDVTEGHAYTTKGTIENMRINISSMGTASSVNLDVIGSNR